MFDINNWWVFPKLKKIKFALRKKKFPIFSLIEATKFVPKNHWSVGRYGRSFEIINKSCFSHFVSYGFVDVVCSPQIIDVFLEVTLSCSLIQTCAPFLGFESSVPKFLTLDLSSLWSSQRLHKSTKI
jgi:hypothetical protein